MDNPNPVLALLQSALTPAVLLGATLWNADKAISDAGAKTLYQAIESTAQTPEKSSLALWLEEFLNDDLTPKNGWITFLALVLVLTAVSMLILLAIYTTRTSGLFEQLLTRGFLLQFIGNGLFVTFLVNLIAFTQYQHLIGSFAAASTTRNVGLVLLDILSKAVLFIALTAITYVAFALLGGAFRGDVLSALGAVPITIRDAVLFRNLTSVYVYSLVLSSFPLFVVVVVKLMVASPSIGKLVKNVFFWLPLKDKPLRVASCLLAVIAGLFAVVFTVLLWWVG